MLSNRRRIVAVSVGNSRVRWCACDGEEPGDECALVVEAMGEAATLIGRLAEESEAEAVVIASVNRTAADELARRLREGGAGGGVTLDIYRVGEDVPVPIATRLHPDAKTGIDRLLVALAAHRVLEQACIVVDAGTAITVDFVDGEGCFVGGAIAPGVRMALLALQEGTDALPGLTFDPPSGSPFGGNTEEAMQRGVFFGARGLVRLLVERYAEAYGAYPPIIATGGDAEALFAEDELVDRVVPDLLMRGIAIACSRAIDDEERDDD